MQITYVSEPNGAQSKETKIKVQTKQFCYSGLTLKETAQLAVNVGSSN